MDNIPLFFLRKMGTYEIQYNGVNITVSLVYDARVVDEKMSEIESLLQNQDQRVVGIDFKVRIIESTHTDVDYVVDMVLVCVGSCCLIFQLNDMAEIPQSLKSFLGDESICFVGKNLDSYASLWKERLELVDRKIGVEVGYLAARVLKKPELLGSPLSIIAGAAGIPKEEVYYSESYDSSSKVFSPEQIKKAIYEVYYSYAIGNKVLGML